MVHSAQEKPKSFLLNCEAPRLSFPSLLPIPRIQLYSYHDSPLVLLKHARLKLLPQGLCTAVLFIWTPLPRIANWLLLTSSCKALFEIFSSTKPVLTTPFTTVHSLALQPSPFQPHLALIVFSPCTSFIYYVYHVTALFTDFLCSPVYVHGEGRTLGLFFHSYTLST